MPAARPGLTLTAAPGLVTMAGIIDERADLVSALSAAMASEVVIDLAGVTFINSLGVRQWIRFLATARDRRIAVRLRRVSEPMIHQLNMIDAARVSARVESFFAPYACDRCGREDTALLDAVTDSASLSRTGAPSLPCPECSGVMVLNDFPQRYFLFLFEP